MSKIIKYLKSTKCLDKTQFYADNTTTVYTKLKRRQNTSLDRAVPSHSRTLWIQICEKYSNGGQETYSKARHIFSR